MCGILCYLSILSKGWKVFFWRKSIFGRVDCITPTCTLTNYRYHSFTPFTFFSKPIWDNQSRFTHKPFFSNFTCLSLSLSLLSFSLYQRSELFGIFSMFDFPCSFLVSPVSIKLLCVGVYKNTTCQVNRTATWVMTYNMITNLLKLIVDFTLKSIFFFQRLAAKKWDDKLMNYQQQPLRVIAVSK